ncbi:MAG: hypothetical protein ACOYMR_09135 [Ilumatobacteraceae bacterium]
MPRGSTNPFSTAAFLWLLRALWIGLAVTVTAAISNAGEDIGGIAGMVAPAVWFLALAVVAVDLVLVSPLGLTIVRGLTPATVPAALLAYAHDDGVTALLAALLGVAATVVALTGEVGEAMAQGSAYGDERRFPLRAPATMLPPLIGSWVAWCALLLGAVVAVGHERWAIAVPLAVLAAAATWLVGRAAHRLSRRWLVLVPAGLVVHDHVVLGETLMVQRTNIRSAALALADTDAADLTGPAGGHAIDVTVKDMVLAVFPATKAQPKGRAIHVQSFLVAPSRPGRALRAMADARLPVG